MDMWESSSNGRRQTALSAACLAIGLLLVFNLQDYGASGSNRQAGFLLGIVLTLIGAATLAVSGRQSVVVDPISRTIAIHDRRPIGHRVRTIGFRDITEVQVACLQTRSQRVLQYFLQLQLRDGETYALFAPGRVYPGASDPTIVAAWKTRLEGCLAVAKSGQAPD